MSKAIIERGAWEGELVERVVQVLNVAREAKPIFPHGIFVDAGANLGQYALTGAVMGFNVIAIEPIPEHVNLNIAIDLMMLCRLK